MKFTYVLLMLLVSLPVAAHGPTPRKTDESILIKAPLEQVWQSISEPCAIAAWHPAIAACTSADAMKRKLALKTGGDIQEEFDEVQVAEKTISYRFAGDVDIKAIAVSSLSGRIRLVEEGGQVRVSWMARYYRAFTGNEPPPGQDDETAMQAVGQYVLSALQGLKAHMEK